MVMRPRPQRAAKFQAMGARRVASSSREPWRPRPWRKYKQSRPPPFSPPRRARGEATEPKRAMAGGVVIGVAPPAAAEEPEPHVERLPADLLAHVLSLLPSFHDLSMAGGVSRRWRRAVERSLAGRRRMSFAGQRTGDDSTARFVRAAVNLRDLDISRSCWGCQITDQGLIRISTADCVKNLTSISLWGLAGITDNGVIQLVSRAHSLQHLNIGGTFITDESLYAVAKSCINLKSIIVWSCRHVTEAGLVALVGGCRRLECINVGGMRVPPESFAGLLAIRPALQIRSIPQILNANVQVS
ncbi:hypothetical protein DAI22_06g047400 [Oryza sativa Japonica Group]|nr:F-box protein At5g67140 isoform X1 [Oryza sativa Japonica Group]KAF2925377.1 hypothetical protein DAI22_06g047400 [Oryza sativa Japonica Group]USI00294.1 F-box domain and LRR containing protein [Oryza sativa Japonica Group]